MLRNIFTLHDIVTGCISTNNKIYLFDVADYFHSLLFHYYCFSPVRSNLDVQSHLDIQKVLVVFQVACHFMLGAPQLTLQLCNGVLHKTE